MNVAHLIPRIPSITRFARVPVPLTNEATYVLDVAGTEWVAKREADMGYQALLAEALTWLLARAIGVRVPDAAFCDDPAERAWLSRRVPDATHWTATAVTGVANVAEAPAILALDAIVLNEARHGGNILMSTDGTTSGVTVWAIDADEARVGHVQEYAAADLAVPDPRILASGFPGSDWHPNALVAADQATRLSRSTLDALVQEACAVARETNMGILAQKLAHRCAHAVELTVEYTLRVEARR